jgi:hypothetical protein
MSYKLLKQAADQLDKLATELEASEKQLAQAKVVKTASADDKAQLLVNAKVAADKLFEAGLLSSAEKRDQFAANIADHTVAIEQLGKLASAAQMPRMGKVVVDDTKTQTKTAGSDEAWDTRARAALTRLNIK